MKELDLDKPSEHVDYEIMPMFAEDGTQVWKVRLLRAPFHGTTVRYGNVQLDGIEEQIRFSFDIVETNDAETFNTDNVDLQNFVSDVLEDIIVVAMKEGWIGGKELNDGNQSTTDDSKESTD